MVCAIGFLFWLCHRCLIGLWVCWSALDGSVAAPAPATEAGSPFLGGKEFMRTTLPHRNTDGEGLVYVSVE
uniref:Putative secreted peptide n=1 Tax=Anopheles braziliensis TaxID=58242 RepID=A0A2M3ZXB8_9DIPT